MKLNTQSSLLFSLCILAISFPSHNAISAEAITEDVSLNFGTFALIDNNAQYTLQITIAGDTVNDPEIVIIIPGVPAQYSLTGFPANTLVSISVTTPTGFTQLLVENPSSEQFSIGNFAAVTPVNTDANGDLAVVIGATLKTSGVGSYVDGLYYSLTDVTVSY